MRAKFATKAQRQARERNVAMAMEIGQKKSRCGVSQKRRKKIKITLARVPSLEKDQG